MMERGRRKQMKIFRILGVLVVFMMGPALAGLPDPITLGVAVESGDLTRAKRWLDDGMDPNMMADRIGSGLMIAAWEGNVPMMELFFSQGGSLHQVNSIGEQALQLAAWRGHIGAVRWLLDHGAPINRDGKAWSALHYAVFAGHREIADLLLARGADVNARAPNDASVLMMAAREGHEELAQRLLEAGADPTLTNDRGETALTWAMRQGNLRIAKRVSSAEAFAEAAKTAPGSPAQKSIIAPSEISDLLRQIREAESAGRSTTTLRRALSKSITRFKQSSEQNPKQKSPSATLSGRPELVITANRKGEERAELVGATGKKADISATPAQRVKNRND